MNLLDAVRQWTARLGEPDAGNRSIRPPEGDDGLELVRLDLVDGVVSGVTLDLVRPVGLSELEGQLGKAMRVWGFDAAQETALWTLPGASGSVMISGDLTLGGEVSRLSLSRP
jgi:hypothetical protein